MLECEFQPDQQIMDQFIQLHTLLIRGINQNISTDTAERGIGKIFVPRFGTKNILKVEAFKPIKNLKELNMRRKCMKKKLKKTKKINKKNIDERVEIKLGSYLKCNISSADAESYYQEQLNEIDKEIEKIQHDSKKQNMGFAFVSFKERRCVMETLEEIELVKQDLISRGKLDKLGIENWEAINAYAPSDLIWEDIANISVQNEFL